jgi:hypothetical protein
VLSTGVEPISPPSNLLHRRGIRFMVVESASSLSNLLHCYRICFVVVGLSSSLNLFRIFELTLPLSNLLCYRRTHFAGVEPGWGIGSCDAVVLFRCLLRWPGVRYRTVAVADSLRRCGVVVGFPMPALCL